MKINMTGDSISSTLTLPYTYEEAKELEKSIGRKLNWKDSKTGKLVRWYYSQGIPQVKRKKQ